MISILVPTRNRPNNIRRLLGSIEDTTSEPKNVEVLFYVDHDDLVSSVVVSEPRKISANIVYGERIPLPAAWDVLYKHSRGDLVMYCGDDVVFQTTGWDVVVHNEFEKYPDKIALVYGDDKIHGERVATHAFVHRNWVDTIGYLIPPYFFNICGDLWITSTAWDIGRNIYLPNLVFEHLHPYVNKAEWDETYTERMKGGGTTDEETLKNKEHIRIQDRNKLKEFIQSYGKQVTENTRVG